MTIRIADIYILLNEMNLVLTIFQYKRSSSQAKESYATFPFEAD